MMWVSLGWVGRGVSNCFCCHTLIYFFYKKHCLFSNASPDERETNQTHSVTIILVCICLYVSGGYSGKGEDILQVYTGQRN